MSRFWSLSLAAFLFLPSVFGEIEISFRAPQNQEKWRMIGIEKVQRVSVMLEFNWLTCDQDEQLLYFCFAKENGNFSTIPTCNSDKYDVKMQNIGVPERRLSFFIWISNGSNFTVIGKERFGRNFERFKIPFSIDLATGTLYILEMQFELEAPLVRPAFRNGRNYSVFGVAGISTSESCALDVFLYNNTFAHDGVFNEFIEPTEAPTTLATTVTSTVTEPPKKAKMPIIIGCSVAFLIVASLVNAFILYCCCCYKKKRNEEERTSREASQVSKRQEESSLASNSKK